MNVHRPIDFLPVFHVLPGPHVLLSPGFEIVEMNAAYLAVTNSRREDILGRNLFEAFPDDGEGGRLVRESLERVRDEGVRDDLALLPYAITTPQGVEVRYWSATHVPILDNAGKVAFILQYTQDVTDLHKLKASAELATNDVLRRAQAVQAFNQTLLAEHSHLRRLFMQAPGFMCVLSGPDHVFELANNAYMHIVGERNILGQSVREALPELENQGIFEILDEVYRTGEPFIGRAMRVMLRASDGTMQEHFLNFVYQPIVAADGSISGIFIEGSDITDQVRAQAQQQLLVDELNHRVKNTLATVQAIATQTLRQGKDPEAFARTFQARLLALSRTHDTLTTDQWRGAGLRRLFEQELSAFGTERVILSGYDLYLPPRIALALGLVVHELAANAITHGALSSGHGHLRIMWDLDKDGKLLLVWREINGPIPLAKRQPGFGTRLIERSITGELSGSVSMTFGPTGFEGRFSIPMGERAS